MSFFRGRSSQVQIRTFPHQGRHGLMRQPQRHHGICHCPLLLLLRLVVGQSGQSVGQPQPRFVGGKPARGMLRASGFGVDPQRRHMITQAGDGRLLEDSLGFPNLSGKKKIARQSACSACSACGAYACDAFCTERLCYMCCFEQLISSSYFASHQSHSAFCPSRPDPRAGGLHFNSSLTWPGNMNCLANARRQALWRHIRFGAGSVSSIKSSQSMHGPNSG